MIKVPARAGDAQRATTQAQLEKLLGSGKRLRDFEPFVTERREPALLALYVTGATEPPSDASLPALLSCPEMVDGIALAGTYHLALVISGTLVNEIAIPGPEDSPDSTTSVLRLPLRNTRQANFLM